MEINQLEYELIKKAKSGDSLALEELISVYRNFIRSRIRPYYLIGAEKEDIIQEGMIGFYKAVMDYNVDKGIFSSFAGICVDRQILSAIKRANRKKHTALNTYVSLNENVYDSCPENYSFIINRNFSPEAIIIDKENFESILKSIKKNLSNFEIKVLSLYLEGGSYTEISNELDKDNKAIDNALQRIKKKVQKLLDM